MGITKLPEDATTRAEAEIGPIAREKLRIPTLQTRKSDRLDFHEVSVWGVRKALWAAYEAGFNAGREYAGTTN